MIIENFTINFKIFDKYSDVKKGITYYLANDIERRNIMTTYKHMRKPIPNIIKNKYHSNELTNLISRINKSDLLKIVPAQYKTKKLFLTEYNKLKKKKKIVNFKMATIIGSKLCYLPNNLWCTPLMLNSVVGTDIGETRPIIEVPISNPIIPFKIIEPFKNINYCNYFTHKNIILILIIMIILIILLISK